MSNEISVSGARPGYHLPTPKGNPVPPEPSKVAISPSERQVFEAWGIKPDEDYGGNGFPHDKKEV